MSKKLSKTSSDQIDIMATNSQQEAQLEENIDLEKLSTERVVPNSEYRVVYSWMYAILHAIGGFYFGYAMTCMNNQAIPVIQSGLNLHGDDYKSVQSAQNLYFGVAKVIFSIVAGTLADLYGRRNLLIVCELANLGSICLFQFSNKWCFFFGRALTGCYLGFVTCIGPRMVNECFPVKKRGSTIGIFCIALSQGVCFSFSLGKMFKNSLNDYWKLFLILPAGLCFLRMLIIQIFYNHKTPKQIISKIEDKAEGMILAEKIMKKYYDDIIDIEKAKKEQQKIALLTAQKGEKSSNPFTEFVNLIKNNIIAKKVRFSALAVLSFNVWPNISGQAFTDLYTKQVFVKLNEPELGNDINFYCGFVVLGSAIIAFFQMDIWGRKNIFVFGSMGLIISMGIMSLSFYINNSTLAFVSFVLANFSIYFGNLGIYYVYVNELGEPFIVGLGLAFLWIFKTIAATILPYIFNPYPIYWTPFIMAIIGMISFIFIRPFFLETNKKTSMEIKKDYANLEYKIFTA